MTELRTKRSFASARPTVVNGPNPLFASSQDAAQRFSEAAVRKPRSNSEVRKVTVWDTADARKAECPCLNSV